MRCAFIEAEKATFPITLCCAVLRVSRAGFYAWRTRLPSARAGADQRLAVEVAAIHAASRQRYGSPRVHFELSERQQHVGRKRVARLMRLQGLRARVPRRFRTTTDSQHALPIAPNVLARRFETPTPNTIWVTDMTYLKKLRLPAALEHAYIALEQHFSETNRTKSDALVTIPKPIAVSQRHRAQPTAIADHGDARPALAPPERPQLTHQSTAHAEEPTIQLPATRLP